MKKEKRSGLETILNRFYDVLSDVPETSVKKSGEELSCISLDSGSSATNVNTKIEYLYRDADNYKVWNECIIKGPLTTEEKNMIISCLEDGQYFIPRLVGLPEKRFEYWDEQSDHIWFELYDDSFELTIEAPTVNINSEELVAAFIKFKETWLQKPPYDILTQLAEARVLKSREFEDINQNKISISQKEMKSMADAAESRLKVHAKKDMASLDKQIALAEDRAISSVPKARSLEPEL